jgi:predicted ATP-grasp superfamily ATP-dependent carboligase
MNALILDGNLKSALAVVRSLGERGVSIAVGAERETCMALHSRYATSIFVYPAPLEGQHAFVDAVKNEAIRLGGKPVVYAFSDATVLALYSHRADLCEYMTLIFPEETSVEIAFDKSATYSLARVSGVPTITTYVPEREEEVHHLAPTLSYPVVMKTRRSVTWKDGKGVFGTATFIHSEAELILRFGEIQERVGESPIVQNLVFGEEYGVEMIAHKGKSFGVVTHHRIRSLSPTGGAGVLKEILDEGDLRNSLETYAKTLVSKLKWSGPIMVEFKVDSDSRVPYLMEINGRFWGSLPLSVASQVDIPHLYYEYAQSGKIPQGIFIPREGTATRHFFGDVRHLIRVFFSRDKMRPHLYPKRMTALRNFFSLPPGTISDVWSWSDPKPAFFELIDIFNKFFHPK